MHNIPIKAFPITYKNTNIGTKTKKQKKQTSVQTCFILFMDCVRNGTGQDFLDSTGTFQNLRRLTGRSTDF